MGHISGPFFSVGVLARTPQQMALITVAIAVIFVPVTVTVVIIVTRGLVRHNGKLLGGRAHLMEGVAFISFNSSA